ncbi:CvpA family protein [Gammaproteobacteria bacterium]|nr:CvpA family protein [Gammaproteobacteria bacterium]
MSVTDIALLVVIAISVLLGLTRGFVRELFSLAKWIVSGFVVWKFGAAITEPIRSVLPAGFADFSPWLSYIAVGIGTLVAMMVVETMAHQLLGRLGIGPIDRVLGAAVGVARAALILIVIVWVGGIALDQRDSDWWRSSRVLAQVEPLAESARQYIPSTRWRDFFALDQSGINVSPFGDAVESPEIEVEPAPSN